MFFLQCENASGDLLWFGDIVANRLLQRFHAARENLDADERRRCELARELGANGGFFTDRPGLLTPAIEGGMFLSHLDRRPDELLFEPESLYRGCLYGAALTSIALTNGSRISELLQVSLDRRKIRTETVQVMTEAKRMQYLHRFHLAVEGGEMALEIAVPDETTLQEMDEKLRAVFERWGTINPTNFGYCGRTGLCPRGNYRALCIGCPHLVPDPAKLDEALHWERLYRQLAEQLRETGSLRDAQQAEAQARNLRDIITMMRLYQQAEVDRQFVPFYRSLPMVKKGN